MKVIHVVLILASWCVSVHGDVLGHAILPGGKLGRVCVKDMEIKVTLGPGGDSLFGESTAMLRNWNKIAKFDVEGDPAAHFVSDGQRGPDTVDDRGFIVEGSGYYWERIEGARPIDGITPKQWQKDCGEEVVMSRAIGMNLTYTLRTDLPGASVEQRDGCSYEIWSRNIPARTPGYAVLQNIADNYNEVFSRKCANAEVTVNVLQLGGWSSRLPSDLRVLMKKENRTYAQISCPIANLAKCIDVTRAVSEYGRRFESSIDQSLPVGTEGGFASFSESSGKYIYLGSAFDSLVKP
jgi:hypothetical protein